jgi:DMSO/TMAO reductase YedYZ heme-binding membrane subunit
MIALIIFLVIVVIVVTSLKRTAGSNERLSKLFNIIRNVAYICILLVVIFSCIVQVGPGEVGVQTLFGSVQEEFFSWLKLVNPLRC